MKGKAQELSFQTKPLPIYYYKYEDSNSISVKEENQKFANEMNKVELIDNLGDNTQPLYLNILNIKKEEESNPNDHFDDKKDIIEQNDIRFHKIDEHNSVDEEVTVDALSPCVDSSDEDKWEMNHTVKVGL